MAYTENFDPSFKQHLSILDSDERKIIEHYYGLNGVIKLNIPAIAEVLRSPGVSATNVRSTVAKCLIKLRGARDAQERRNAKTMEQSSRQKNSVA